MTADLEPSILVLSLLFCRIGGCLLLAPGLSSPRVPVNIRLFIALGITAAVAPLLADDLRRALAEFRKEDFAFLIMKETLTGILIGLMARCFFLALQFAATAISNFIGLSGIPGIPLEEGDTGSPLATLVSTSAVTLVFAVGLHIEMIKAAADSYTVLPLGSVLLPEVLLVNLLRALAETWLLSLRLCAPFLLYGVVVNLVIGLGNRFAQQISAYHATTGAVMLGGFFLFYLMWNDWNMLFLESYRAWLSTGGF